MEERNERGQTLQEFLDAYVQRHAEKYDGEQFQI